MSEDVDKTEHVVIISDAEVTSFFVLFDISRADNDNYLRLILQLKEHTELTVGTKAGKYASRVMIVVELAAELKVELSSVAGYALSYMFRLKSKIFVVVESDFRHFIHPPMNTKIQNNYTTFVGCFQVNFKRFFHFIKNLILPQKFVSFYREIVVNYYLLSSSYLI